MTVRAFPFDGVFVHEEDYLALQSAQRGGGIVGDPDLYSDGAVDQLSGVVRFSNHLDVVAALHVTPGAGRSVDVDIGRAMAPGFLFENDAVANLEVAVNATGSVRYDTVVARFDFANNIGELDIVVAGGATRGFPVWEVPLAQLAVPDGFATLASTDIRDLRRWAGENVPWGRAFGGGTGASRYFMVGGVGLSMSLTIAANVAYILPFLAAAGSAITKVSIVSGPTVANPGILHLYLYRAADSHGMPDEQLYDFGTLNVAAINTVYEAGAAVVLVNPGVYYVAYCNLTGANIGGVRSGEISLATGFSLAQPDAVHVGGVSLAVDTVATLPASAYYLFGLGGVMPNPISAVGLNRTPWSPVVYLS